ncbi:hypothetical protein [Phaeocystidibacter marisrubri]|uniref:Lipoprotein n=1 Tax=Phaeocystidibacter marisrubri TaxID=1577780 RepID=A0A6L3ZEF6_9FLAO|nr:hypothetical protein [Phaeocystidibacter marisrubri]KAB2816006.1 hypothetical protein F8C82_09940 [Phaeocystidibacter marisrubri]GGH66845.1 hypothetical protein GCM10011318_05220 [Phaeocystidibacter marisrubri]
MKRLLSLTGVCTLLTISAQATVPEYLDVRKSGGGPEGYDKVRQDWTGENRGKLTCYNEGTSSCHWREFIGAQGYPIDIDFISTQILNEYENGNSNRIGTIVVGDAIVHYWILESLGNGDGTIRFRLKD